MSVFYRCVSSEGEATMRTVTSRGAAEAYAHQLALDGELRDGRETVVTVTGPTGIVDRWRCHCHMDPLIDVWEEGALSEDRA